MQQNPRARYIPVAIYLSMGLGSIPMGHVLVESTGTMLRRCRTHELKMTWTAN